MCVWRLLRRLRATSCRSILDRGKCGGSIERNDDSPSLSHTPCTRRCRACSASHIRCLVRSLLVAYPWTAWDFDRNVAFVERAGDQRCLLFTLPRHDPGDKEVVETEHHSFAPGVLRRSEAANAVSPEKVPRLVACLFDFVHLVLSCHVVSCPAFLLVVSTVRATVALDAPQIESIPCTFYTKVRSSPPLFLHNRSGAC